TASCRSTSLPAGRCSSPGSSKAALPTWPTPGLPSAAWSAADAGGVPSVPGTPRRNGDAPGPTILNTNPSAAQVGRVAGAAEVHGREMSATGVLESFARHLAAERGHSQHTVRAYVGDVRSLLSHAAAQKIDDPTNLD